MVNISISFLRPGPLGPRPYETSLFELGTAESGPHARPGRRRAVRADNFKSIEAAFIAAAVDDSAGPAYRRKPRRWISDW